jgi:hypothetical protein
MQIPDRLPNFLIIGAMKCGTSTLHEQLARRPGLFLSNPKEPNFFGDDACHARGLGWYGSLFAKAEPQQLCGESSTHYSKRPTFPHATSRIAATLPEVRVIYLMRDPLERIVSQYIHEWTEREVSGSLDRAVQGFPHLVAYSEYAYQLEPYLESLGADRVLPVFFERMAHDPRRVLEEVCAFIGDPSAEPAVWDPSVGRENVSSERMRQSPWRDALVHSPLGRALRRIAPQGFRESVKGAWRMRSRPAFSPQLRSELESRIDRDLARLGRWLGVELTCRGWREQVLGLEPRWVDPPRRHG